MDLDRESHVGGRFGLAAWEKGSWRLGIDWEVEEVACLELSMGSEEEGMGCGDLAEGWGWFVQPTPSFSLLVGAFGSFSLLVSLSKICGEEAGERPWTAEIAVI